MLTWSKKQTRYYVTLQKRIANITSWTALAKACFEDFEEARPPVDEKVIKRFERKLRRALPEELRSFYLECNGFVAQSRSSIVFPIQDLFTTNERVRNNSLYEMCMPFDHLLFFGEEGNGDMYAFPIQADGQYRGGDVFEWEHESDSRKWKANSLRDLLLRIATEFLD
jgi:hypothetical protein